MSNKNCLNCKYSAIDIFEEADFKCVNEKSEMKEKVVKTCDVCDLYEDRKNVKRF